MSRLARPTLAVTALEDRAVPAAGVFLVSGASDARALQYVLVNGTFALGPAFQGFADYTGPVRVASLDVNGDKSPERIVAAGPGGSPFVAVFDGLTGQAIGGFFAFEPTFTGGVLLAGGDFDGNGREDLVVAADVGGGPRVRVFDGALVTIQGPPARADFFAIDDVNFRGGARPTVGDVNADGTPDLVVAAGPGGGPRVAVFDGREVAAGRSAPNRLMPDFFAFEPTLRDGAFPSAGDVDGDGFADLAFGAGPGGAPRVLVVGGRRLLTAGVNGTVDQTPGLGLASFFAGDPTARAGVTVLARDFDGDGRADLVTGSGPGRHSEVRVYGNAKVLGALPQPDQTFDPFGAVVAGGVFVG
jgi:hypothetical protein